MFVFKPDFAKIKNVQCIVIDLSGCKVQKKNERCSCFDAEKVMLAMKSTCNQPNLSLLLAIKAKRFPVKKSFALFKFDIKT